MWPGGCGGCQSSSVVVCLALVATTGGMPCRAGWCSVVQLSSAQVASQVLQDEARQGRESAVPPSTRALRNSH